MLWFHFFLQPGITPRPCLPHPLPPQGKPPPKMNYGKRKLMILWNGLQNLMLRPWKLDSSRDFGVIFDNAFVTCANACDIILFIIWAPSSEFVSSSIPSWHILTVHAQPFRGARDLVFCVKVPLDSLLVWASSEGSGETARMHRLAWTFAARIGDKYQIRLTRSIWLWQYFIVTLCHIITRGPLVLYRSPDCWGYVKINSYWGKNV